MSGSSLKQDNMPKHVAIIMDGNGRWAKQRGRERTYGHKQGSEAVRKAVRFARQRGVDALTLYAFSEQNWSRPSLEISALMHLLQEFLLRERDEIIKNQIRFTSIGRRHKLPKHLVSSIEALERDTKDHTAMTLTVALSYGGQEEIADRARVLAERVAQHEIKPEDIDVHAFEDGLSSMGVGPVDLLIRTGGEQRISNFLLWGCAYAELLFSDCMWPDFDEKEFEHAIRTFQSRQRRFGNLDDISGPSISERTVA